MLAIFCLITGVVFDLPAYWFVIGFLCLLLDV